MLRKLLKIAIFGILFFNLSFGAFFRTYPDGSGTIMVRDREDGFTVTSQNLFGIGTSTPATELEVFGSVSANTIYGTVVGNISTADYALTANKVEDVNIAYVNSENVYTVTQNFQYMFTEGIGIDATPNLSDKIVAGGGVAGAVRIKIMNTNSVGNAQLEASNDLGYNFALGILGSAGGFGLFENNSAAILSSGYAGFNIVNDGANPIKFYIDEDDTHTLFPEPRVEIAANGDLEISGNYRLSTPTPQIQWVDIVYLDDTNTPVAGEYTITGQEYLSFPSGVTSAIKFQQEVPSWVDDSLSAYLVLVCAPTGNNSAATTSYTLEYSFIGETESLNANMTTVNSTFIVNANTDIKDTIKLELASPTALDSLQIRFRRNATDGMDDTLNVINFGVEYYRERL